MRLAMLLLQGDSSSFRSPFLGPMFWFPFCLLVIVVAAGLWKMFDKAGHPGWACLVPFYNVYIMLKIAGRPGWWLLLFFVPLVNIVIQIIVAIDIAKAFGQGTAFGFFLNFLLGGIGYVILGFGNYQYLGPQTQAMAARV